MPKRTLEEVRQFVGNGVRLLMIRAVPDGESNPLFEETFALFKDYYGEHCNDNTKPYAGVVELIETLKKKGYAVAIVSNKIDFAVKELNDLYFKGIVPVAIGEKEGIQDTRKNTYELLHTKPVTAIQYICGKVISGFISMLGVLVILNVIFFMLCLKTSLESGFPVTPIDFCVNSLIYIVPNLLMICCVYTITAVIFKNPLPAAPILFLHIIYSNMLTMKNDIYYMRPFSIMVRFPGRFFETHAAKMSNINQIILVISSVILVCISVTIWKRRRVH